MKSRDGNTKWLNLFMVTMALIFLTLYMSLEEPLLLNAKENVFFCYLFPIIIFLGFIFLLMRSNKGVTGFQRFYRGDSELFGNGIRAVLCALTFAAAFSWMVGYLSFAFLAYPTKYLATTRSSTVAQVTEISPHTFSFKGYTDLHVKLINENRLTRFNWPTNALNQIGTGSCVTIGGRSWALGTFVETIVPAKCNP